ncbi:MAG: PQQ-binding-like beta-propeller repeat protein [Acidobacteria bacterium]|nr:PQQ-binding-like beta-propeller repeat protein [Acidobacteriota bacterium]MBA3887014.1 PQQ-binding-like beta-propeller repeat protein [Acidobacteriota bacterium]
MVGRSFSRQRSGRCSWGCFSEDGFFYALEVASGKVRWRFETALGIASSPSATDDKVFFGGKAALTTPINS